MTTLSALVTTLPKVVTRPSSCQDLAHDHRVLTARSPCPDAVTTRRAASRPAAKGVMKRIVEPPACSPKAWPSLKAIRRTNEPERLTTHSR
jgi:hypothetical protein